jgi:hypothetical protein
LENWVFFVNENILCTEKGIGKEKIEFDQQMFIATKVWASKMCRIYN